jgi:hypothetical protein
VSRDDDLILFAAKGRWFKSTLRNRSAFRPSDRRFQGMGSFDPMEVGRRKNAPFIVSMSPLGYPEAWLCPRSTRFRFAQQDHCSSATTCRSQHPMDSAKTRPESWSVIALIAPTVTRLWSPPRYTDWTMPSEPPTLTRRSFLSAAAAGIVSSPIWAKAITARVSDSRLLSDIEHRTFSFYWERVNHGNGLMADRWSTPSACSITGTGFALTAWPIGVERGWITIRNIAMSGHGRCSNLLTIRPIGLRLSVTFESLDSILHA